MYTLILILHFIVCLLLILGGMAYTLAMEYWLKKQAERENENTI